MIIGYIDFLNYSALALLALAPVLILLYFLKLKRPQIKVASTLLWQKVLEDMRVNSPFQRLKKSLLLLIQLILLVRLMLPTFGVGFRFGRCVLRSASTGATHRARRLAACTWRGSLCRWKR